jgi:glycosyltransferase involved in cell wall biosynthesis
MSTTEYKKSVLVVTSTFPRWINDSDPPFVMELCKRLAKENINVDVLAPHTIGSSKKEVVNGVNIYRYKYFFSKWELLAYEGGILANIKKNKLLYFLVPLFIFSQARSILKLIKNNKYDLIHAHWLIPQGLISVFISKYIYKDSPKILCTSHGSDLFSLQSAFYNNVKKWVLNNSDVVTVVSENMREACLQLTNIEEKIHVCSMGVDLVNVFIPSENVKRDSNKILFVGRLVDGKGVSILLESMQIIFEKYQRVKLIIVGDGSERRKLETLCENLDIEHAVEFLGALNQSQLPEIYSSASIAVIPSNSQEGLGLVTIEAMGCGCAVIVSVKDNVNDIIEDGVNGIMVKSGDEKDLANAIDLLLSNKDKLERIALNGRESIIKKFDWSTVANKYKKIIESVCE